MTPAVPARDVWSDLVGGLLDARVDPATARFDAELSAGLADGSLTEDAAHRLRFWQRASVRALADHARTVLPVALGALEAARHEAERDATEAADVLGEPVPTPVPELAEQHVEPEQQVPESAEQQAEPEQHVEPERQAEPTLDVSAVAAARRASAPQPPETSTLDLRPRLLVAGLTTVNPAPARPDRAS